MKQESKNDLKIMLSDLRNSDTKIIDALNDLKKIIHETAKFKKWWKRKKEFYEEPLIMAGMLSLVFIEISESVECLRKPIVKKSEKIPDFFDIEEEFVDVIIRIFNFAEYHNLNIIDAFFAKLKYNIERSICVNCEKCSNWIGNKGMKPDEQRLKRFYRRILNVRC